MVATYVSGLHHHSPLCAWTAKRGSGEWPLSKIAVGEVCVTIRFVLRSLATGDVRRRSGQRILLHRRYNPFFLVSLPLHDKTSVRLYPARHARSNWLDLAVFPQVTADAAHAVIGLLEPAAERTTGSIFAVDGGATA